MSLIVSEKPWRQRKCVWEEIFLHSATSRHTTQCFGQRKLHWLMWASGARRRHSCTPYTSIFLCHAVVG